MRRFINRESVTLIVLSMVVMAVICAATFAWFMEAAPVSVENINLNMDDKGDLYVRVKVEENENNFVDLKEVGTGEQVKYTIDLNIVAQDNIEENTLAPGAYGKVEFKIISRTSLTTGYTIKITPSITINDKYDETTASLNKEELFELVKTHIKFYAVNDAGVYSRVIPYYDETTENCWFQNTLEEGIEEDVTLYWYWPYEYINIPDIDNTDSPVYSEYEKYRSLTSQAAQIEAYDWDDTYIGNYVEELIFHFDVEGIRS